MSEPRSMVAREHSHKQQEARFRAIHSRIHARHPDCLRDEWLTAPCRLAGGRLARRPIVWSRRNGPWQHHDVLWVGAAPGNAGGKGRGALGAHGTRIPFGGDIAGGNLEVLLSSIGLDRNRTFISAAFNQLPAAGGGEPTLSELRAPVGDYPSSVHIVRDTILAVGPRLLVALGNVALRVIFAAVRLEKEARRLPSLRQLQAAGLSRNVAGSWLHEPAPDPGFLAAWQNAWPGAELPHLLWINHPSAQNMSPFAGTETLFHTRMREARDALRRAARDVLHYYVPDHRSDPPDTGIYALPEWRELVAPRQHELDRLWRSRGL
ncbi:MAG: uracil-DNA glycosylase family protein [Longimicrobiales bacterium]